jgi:uncharacterized protein YdcH (DUF465 family)
MDLDLRDLRNRLVETDDEFARLFRQHSELEIRLQQLSSKSHLTDIEQLEEVNTKKWKLSLKDQMERILHKHKKELCAKS